jgi:CheY-like chemotaxis protein
MRLEVDPNASGFSPLNANVSQPNDQEKFAEYLNAGVKAAQSGDRKAARRNLMSALDIDAQSENAWLWLASISEYPEELLVFLNNVLDINPKNERALQWSASTKLLLSKTLVQRGIDAHENGRRDFALQCFDQALSYDMHNVTAWLWLAALCDSEEKRLEYFRRVLEIEPENETARSAVEAAEAGSRQALYNNAAWCAVNGDALGAVQFLDKVFEKWPDDKESWILRSHLSESVAERIACVDRILAIDANDDYAIACRSSLRSVEDAAKDRSPSEPVEESNPQPAAQTEPRDEAPLEFVPLVEESEPTAETVWPDEIDTNDAYMSDEYQTVDAMSLPEEVVEEQTSFEHNEPVLELDETSPRVFDAVEVSYDRPVEAYDDPFAAPAEPVAEIASAPIVDDRVKVLVVENNPTARKLMAGKLESSGYNVICAETGRDAVLMVNAERPSLVLADIAMSGMDGYAICRMLRDDPANADLPVILISGKDAYYDEDLGAAAGASGFITKPFGPESLMKTVESFLAAASRH